MARELQPLDVKLTTYRDLTDPSDNARPPDAGIRGITAIIQTAIANTGQNTGQMMAAAPRGLNIVTSGLSSAPRAPQRISGLYSELLAAGAIAGVVAASSKKSSKPDAKVEAKVETKVEVKNAGKPTGGVKPEEPVESKDGAVTEPADTVTEVKDEPPPADDKGAKGEKGTHSKPVKKRHGKVKEQPVKPEEKPTNGGDVVAETKPLDEDTNGDGVLNSEDDLDKNGDGALNSDDLQEPGDEIAGSTDGGDPISTSEPPPDGETSSDIPADNDLDVSTS